MILDGILVRGDTNDNLLTNLFKIYRSFYGHVLVSYTKRKQEE